MGFCKPLSWDIIHNSEELVLSISTKKAMGGKVFLAFLSRRHRISARTNPESSLFFLRTEEQKAVNTSYQALAKEKQAL